MCLNDVSINFNSGEFYGESDLLSPALIAIGSIILTVLVQRLYDNLKSNEQLDGLYEFMKLESLALGKSALKQYDSVSDMIRGLKSNHVIDKNFVKVAGFNLSQLDEWNTSNFYNAIVNRRTGEREHLIGLHSRLKVVFRKVQEIEIALMSAVKNFNDRQTKIQDKWSEYVQTIGVYLDQFRREYEKAPTGNDEFLTSFDRIVAEWQKNPQNSRVEMDFVYVQLVIPLLDLCRKYLRKDDRAFYLMQTLNELKAAHQNLTYLKKKYRAWFIGIGRQLLWINREITVLFSLIEAVDKRSKFL